MVHTVTGVVGVVVVVVVVSVTVTSSAKQLARHFPPSSYVPRSHTRWLASRQTLRGGRPGSIVDDPSTSHQLNRAPLHTAATVRHVTVLQKNTTLLYIAYFGK